MTVVACKVAGAQVNQEAGGWHNVGIAHAQAGRHQDAVSAFQRSLQVDPALVESWMALGRSYLHMGDSEQALKSFRRASVQPNAA